MEIKIKLLNPKAEIPQFKTDGAAGADVKAVSMNYNVEHGTFEYHLGFSMEIPKGYAALLLPRSSVCKTGGLLTNCCGLIDSDYRGELKAVFRRIDNKSKLYEAGDYIGQLVIIQVPQISYKQVDELSKTVRGSGGYGSTDKKKDSVTTPIEKGAAPIVNELVQILSDEK